MSVLKPFQFILLSIACLQLGAQEMGIDYNKLRFFVADTEFASMNYHYYPFGPITELKSSHYLGTIRLNSNFNIDFRTGGSSVSEVKIDNYGYTKLGSDAPNIKMKYLTGVSSGANNGATQIPHGLGSANRILSVQVHMDLGTSSTPVFYPPGVRFPTLNYVYFYDNHNVTVQNAAESGTTIQNKPIRVLVVYTDN